MNTVSASLSLFASELPIQGQGSATLIELRLKAAKNCAVTLVLDFLDSCPPMRAEFAKLPRLLEALPRKWPIWLYCLSNPAPLDGPEPITLGHLLEGSVSLTRWTQDLQTLELSRRAGSLIRPVIDSICIRQAREEVDEVLILALGDGELLDVGPVALPTSVRIIGLVDSIACSKREHWRRVFPKERLCTLMDPNVDAMLKREAPAFAGRCSLNLILSARDAAVSQLLSDGTIKPMSSSGLEWDFIDGSVLLLIPLSFAQLSDAKITCDSLQRSEQVVVPIKSACGPVPEESLQLAIRAMTATAAPSCQIVLDMSTGDPNFETAWQSIQVAISRAREHRPWVDEDRRLAVFTDSGLASYFLTSEGRTRWDALACFVAEADEAKTQSRLVVLGLSRHSRPALRLPPGNCFGMFALFAELRIDFDRMEGRWMLSLENQSVPSELNPRGSQMIALSDLAADEVRPLVIFSGDLR